MIHPSSTFTIYQTLNHQGYNAAIRALAASAVYLHPLISLAPWAEALKLCRTAGVLRVSTDIHSVLVNQSVVDITKCRTLFVLFVFNNVVSICFMFYSRDTPRYPTLVSCFFVFAELPAPFFSAWKRRQNQHDSSISRKMEEDSVQADLGTYNGPLGFFILVRQTEEIGVGLGPQTFGGCFYIKNIPL